MQFAAAGIAEKRLREELCKKIAATATDQRNVLSNRKKKAKSDAKKGDKGSKVKIVKSGVEKNNRNVDNPKEDMPQTEVILQEDSSDDEDVDFGVEEWTVIRHAVDETDNKPKFMVHYGKREDGRGKHMWGEYGQLEKDGVLGLDAYIIKNCCHQVYNDLLIKTRKRKAVVQMETAVVAKPKRSPCNHGDSTTYQEEINAKYCGRNYYLYGIECGDGCGATFVQSKASELKEGVRGVMPGSSTPVYRCINMRPGNEAPCGHAVCNDCWTTRLLAQSNNDSGGRRTSSRK